MVQPNPAAAAAPSLTSFFSGGGGKSISWKDQPLGTTYGGTILAIHPPTIQTDPASGEMKTKRDGSPAFQVRIDLQTDYRDPQDPQDEGRRGMYVSGWMQGAVGDAVRNGGGGNDGPQVGGQLFVRLTERTPNERVGLAPINKFDAYYRPPTGAESFFANQGSPVPQQQAPAAPPVQQQPFPGQQAPVAQQPGQFPGQPVGFPQQGGQPPQQQAAYPPAPGFPPMPQQQAPQFQTPVPSMTPGAGYAIPPGTPMPQQAPAGPPPGFPQQGAPQPPAGPPPGFPQQQAPQFAPPAGQQLTPEQVAAQLGGQIVGQQPAPQGPAKPPGLSDEAWNQMDPATKARTAEVMGANPPTF